MTSHGSALAWLEEVLQAERQSVELHMASRHASLLKKIAPVLQDIDSKHLPAPEGPVLPSFELNVLVAGDVNAEEKSSSECVSRSACPTPVVKEQRRKDQARPGMDRQGQAKPGKAKQCQAGEENVQLDSSISRRVTPPEPEPDDGWRERLSRFLDGAVFDAFICVIIVINSICIGLETSLEIEGEDVRLFLILEHVFLAIYIIELCLHFVAKGLDCLKSGWITFDLVLVIMGALSLYVLGPIFENMENDSGGVELFKKMTGLLVMRALRLFRLARLLRLVAIFRTLYKLVRGLVGSVGTIFYAFGLIILILYIFSCLALELVTKNLRDNEKVGEIVELHFNNLPITMLSLMQFVTADSISSMYFPLVKEEPTLLFLFLPAILVISVSLANLVTAVIVDGAIKVGNEDAEALRRYQHYEFLQILPELKRDFKAMDQDGNGILMKEEFEHAPVSIRQALATYFPDASGNIDSSGALDKAALRELFEMIDTDNSGQVDSDEFCDGIAEIVKAAGSVVELRILKQIQGVRRDLTEVKSGLRFWESQQLESESIGHLTSV